MASIKISQISEGISCSYLPMISNYKVYSSRRGDNIGRMFYIYTFCAVVSRKVFVASINNANTTTQLQIVVEQFC